MSDPCTYVLADELKAGDTVIVDGRFSCIQAGAERTIERDPERQGEEIEKLFVRCDHGQHYLDGQLGWTPATRGRLVGITRKAA